MITLQHFGRGLSWLRVPYSLLKQIDIQLRGIRYRSGDYVYLQDIADQYYFQDSLTQQGIQFQVEQKPYAEVEQFIKQD